MDFYIVIQVRSHFSRAHPMMKGISRVHACTCIFLSSNQTDREAAPKQWQVTKSNVYFPFCDTRRSVWSCCTTQSLCSVCPPRARGDIKSSTLNHVCTSLVCLLSSALQTCPLLSARRSLLPPIKEEEWDWSLQHTFSLKKYSLFLLSWCVKI